ncbi:MAG TPA: hypothetical protein VK590_00325 [Saprospiraceae bacterium]|nr:hypothetical protein [Saprospiraceae bacterium]
MKRSSIKKSLVALGAVLFMLTASSCNRGTGCPSNFSLKSVVTLVQGIL